MKKCIIYLRKSTESEERQVQSIDGQEKWCLEYAENNGFQIVEIIKESKSAKSPGRKGFNQMILSLSEGKANHIICWSLNRLSRNSIDEGTLKWYTQNSIIKEIHSTDGVSNGDNILLMSMHFGMATQFVIDLKKSVKRGMDQKFERGGAISSAPTGYWNDKNTNEYKVDEKQAEYVKQIFHMKREGNSYSEISKALFNKGFETKAGKPKPPSVIEYIVRNRFYYGILSFQGQSTEGIHTPLISKQLYSEANGLRKTPKDVQKLASTEFLFKNMIKYQGKAMRHYIAKKTGGIYYREGVGIKPSFNISENKLLTIISEHMPQYQVHKNFHKEAKDGFFDFYNDFVDESSTQISKIRKSIEDLKNQNKQVAKKNAIGVTSDNIAMEIQEENLGKIEVLEDDLSNFHKAELIAFDETVELFKLLTVSQKAFIEGEKYTKRSLLQLLGVELLFNTKKELTIEEDKLFEIVKSINNINWHPHLEGETNLKQLYEYLLYNFEYVVRLNESAKFIYKKLLVS